MENYAVLLASSNNRLLAFSLDELKRLNKGRGLQLMQLAGGDHLVAISLTTEAMVTVEVQGPRGKQSYEKIRREDIFAKRAKKGKPLPVLGKIVNIS